MRLTFALAALALMAGPALAQPVEPGAAAPVPEAPSEPKPPMIDQSGISPESLRDIDQLWDDRIRSSVAAAQALQGPLDGRWLLVADDATPLFVFQFVDPAGGRGPLEGVWRDLRRPPHTGAYGVVPGLQRIGPTLNLSFLPPGTSMPIRIALQGDLAGGWRGQMTENGAVTAVSLRRGY